jgi:hypothetical protein
LMMGEVQCLMRFLEDNIYEEDGVDENEGGDRRRRWGFGDTPSLLGFNGFCFPRTRPPLPRPAEERSQPARDAGYGDKSVRTEYGGL